MTHASVRGTGVSLVAIVTFALALMGCQAGSQASTVPTTQVPEATPAPQSPSVSTTGLPEPTQSASVSSADGCGETSIFVDYLPFTVADLRESEWDVSLATVQGFEAARFNTDDGKAPAGFGTKSVDPASVPPARIYTPVTVDVQQAIKGDDSPGPATYAIEGGTVGCYTTTVDAAPRVEAQGRYVFILAPVLDAAGNVMPSLMEAKFAWPVHDDETVATVDGPMSLYEFVRQVSGTSPSMSPDADATK